MDRLRAIALAMMVHVVATEACRVGTPGPAAVTDVTVEVDGRDAGDAGRSLPLPARVHRVGELDRPERWVFSAVLVVLLAMPLYSAVAVLLDGWRLAGDNALIGLRTNDVLRGRFPMIGQPTPSENFGSGIETSHPGPIEFYLLAPFVFILGPTWGLAIGAAGINAAAMVGSAWLAFRRGRLPLMVLSAVALLALSRALGGNFLHDPVSSQIGTMAAAMTLFAAWAVLAGDLRAAPVFVVVASFTLQDHLAYLATSGPVVIVGLAATIWWFRRLVPQAPGQMRSAVTRSLAIGLVLWSPVLIDEFFGVANLGAIWQTFTGERTVGEGVLFALQRLAEALSPWPVFMGRARPLAQLHLPSTVEFFCGALVLTSLVSLTSLAWMKGRRDLCSGGVVALIGVAAGFSSAVKLPVGSSVQASNLRWMWVVSMFVWVVVAWIGWSLLPAALRAFFTAPLGVLAALASMGLIMGIVGTTDVETDRDGALMEDLTPFLGDVRAGVEPGRYRVQFSGGPVVVSFGPAIVTDLAYRGDDLFMDVGPFTRAYGDDRAWADQEVDGTLLITADAPSRPPGAELVARQGFDVNRRDQSSSIVRVYLLPDESRSEG